MELYHCTLIIIEGFVTRENCGHVLHTAELQWFEHLWNHEKMFEKGVLRVIES